MNSSCAKSHMSLPLPVHTLKRVLTLRASLYTQIYSQIYIFHITDTFVYDSVLCELTYVCALASAHTQNLFAYIHMSQVYLYSITDMFVYQPVLCNLTLVRAIAGAHTQNLFVYIHMLTILKIYRIMISFIYAQLLSELK